jgi:hypothetical protein
MAFEDSGRHPPWPKVADAVIEAGKGPLNFPDSTGFCGGQKRYHAKSLKIKSGNVFPQRHHKICG